MNDADAKAWCAAHGIDTQPVTGEDGTTLLTIDEEGMRQIADLAPNPARAHALIDQWITEADMQA
jgi:hypothetical protein